MSARTHLAALQAVMLQGDDLMARVIDEMKQHADLLDELEDLERFRSVTRAASASFVVEAAGILREQQQAQPAPCLFGCAPAHAWHQ